MKIDNFQHIKSHIISVFNRGIEIEILGINSLVCYYFKQINLINLNEIEINTCKVDRRKIKLGYCYGNSSNRLNDHHLYVEGVATNKKTFNQTYHAWNINENDSHIDYTFAEISDKFTYQGLIIPSEIVREVGYRKNGVWGPVIPFLTDDELKKVLSYNKN